MGARYPAEGDVRPTDESTAPSEETSEEPTEVVGAQLDALSAMAVRQHDRAAASAPEHSPTAESTVEQPVEAATHQQEDAEVSELVLAGSTAAGVEAGTVETPTPVAGSQSVVDPLTSPLAEVSAGLDWPVGEAPPPAPDPVDQTHPQPHDATERVATPAEPVAAEPVAAEPVAAESVSGLSRLLRASLLVVAVANLALAGLGLALGPVDDGSVGLGPALATLALALLTLAAWAATAGLFLVWVSRMHRRVTMSSAVPQRHSHTVAVAGWLIPVYGLYLGWQVFCDLWTGSDPQTRDQVPDKPTQPRVVNLWLASFAASVLVGFAAPLAVGSSPGLDLVSAACLGVAALALGSIVTTLARWQQPEPVVTAA